MAAGTSIALAAMAASGGMSAMAKNNAGKAQQKLANYNASVTDMQADDAIVRGREAERRHRVQTKQLIGSQRAAFAASGVDVNDPDSTAVNVTADTAALSEMDALSIRTNAAREAWGYKVQATDYRNRGKIARAQGKAEAIGTILSTGANMYGAKYGFKG